MFLGKVKQNIIVLAVSNLIIGLIEFIFNMYLSRIFGAEGLGLLSLVSPINCLFLSFMTEGLVVTISKISAKHQHFRNYAEMDVSIKISTAFSFLWSLFLVGVVFLTAKPIATWFLGDSSLTYTILATCPLMILMSISNIVKGHFLGLAKIKVPSAINISEKILRFPILYCLMEFCPEVCFTLEELRQAGVRAVIWPNGLLMRWCKAASDLIQQFKETGDEAFINRIGEISSDIIKL